MSDTTSTAEQAAMTDVTKTESTGFFASLRSRFAGYFNKVDALVDGVFARVETACENRVKLLEDVRMAQAEQLEKDGQEEAAQALIEKPGVRERVLTVLGSTVAERGKSWFHKLAAFVAMPLAAGVLLADALWSRVEIVFSGNADSMPRAIAVGVGIAVLAIASPLLSAAAMLYFYAKSRMLEDILTGVDKFDEIFRTDAKPAIQGC